MLERKGRDVAIVDCDWYSVRRKLGGVAGYPHRGISCLRLRPTPCRSTSARQVVGRSNWSRLTKFWSSELSEAEQYEWDYVAEWLTWYDEQEQWRHMLGFDWFCALNARRLMAGLDINRDGSDVDWAWGLDTLSVALLDEDNARFTFTPDPYGEYEGLVIYGRGPVAAGETRAVPAPTWGRTSVPGGWQWIGFGGLGVDSPVDLELPMTIPAGMKLRVIGNLMDRSGGMSDEWLHAEVLGT